MLLMSVHAILDASAGAMQRMLEDGSDKVIWCTNYVVLDVREDCDRW